MHLKFSQDLEAFLKRLERQPLTLRDLLKETSEKGFSLIIILLVLPFLVPMPPGLSSILGSGILLLSVQMLLGKKLPWLPRKLAQFQFLERLLHNFSKLSSVLLNYWRKWCVPVGYI